MCRTSSGMLETDDKTYQQNIFLKHHAAVSGVIPPSEDFTAPRAPYSEHLPEHHSVVLNVTPSKDTNTLRSIFPPRARQPQQPTSLIFVFNSASRSPLIHGVSYAARSSYILNIATAPTPVQTITEDNRNHSQQSKT